MRVAFAGTEINFRPWHPGLGKVFSKTYAFDTETTVIDEELSAISKLEASWPRSLLASTVADQAQHLTLLRQALGAGPLASAPVPFENGTAEPPAQ